MSQSEAGVQYAKALKAGQKTYRECVLAGRYPYLQILDEILTNSMISGRVDLGVIDVPAEQIVGTKSAGRTRAFAADFMPLLPPSSEFAAKWTELCAAHLGDEGIRDPIRCYEYMGRFYVQEGNKRVSVLKSFGARSVPGYVTRLIPVYSDDEAVAMYYEFLDFYRLSSLYGVYFSRRGGYAKLQAALGYDPDHVWSEEERRRFQSSFFFFREAFRKLGGAELGITPADALLVWLEFYPLGTIKELSTAEIHKTLAAIWPDVRARAEAEPIEVNLDAPDEPPPERGIIGRILGGKATANHVNVAFVNLPDPAHSAWTAAHDMGRRTLEQAMYREVSVRVYNLENGDDIESAMERAVAEGAEVVFATAPPLISACRKLAARYPEVKVLNCAVAMPYPGVRTYYSRVYEGKFITGAIAGALAKSGRIGYVAGSPIFGVPASINAFALGALLTNPAARIDLEWSCVNPDPAAALISRGAELISNRDIPWQGELGGGLGLARVESDGSLTSLASPYWDWGSFYIRLVSSILRGGWEALNYKGSGKAVNYWWGMSAGVVGLELADELPDGPRSLANILCRSIIEGEITVFHRRYRSQDGSVISDGNRWLSPEDVLHMDWLVDTVDGRIPGFDELLPMSRRLVRLLGVYRDSLPPEKGGAAP